MKRYYVDGWGKYEFPEEPGPYVLWTDVEQLLSYLNQDKDGDYFLRKEAYEELFGETK